MSSSNVAEKTMENVLPRVVLFREGFELFGKDRSRMRDLLGGKGAGLAEMTSAGIPVPPGMTILTAVCREYYAENKRFPAQLMPEVKEKLETIQKSLSRELGSTARPLLLSVRSGAKFSMPGMMDTILNLGLNDETVEALAKETKNPRFAWDSYRRFIQMFGNVVFDIEKHDFEALLDEEKSKAGVVLDNELSAEKLQSLVTRFKTLVKNGVGRDFPQDPWQQLQLAIEAVFRSWNNSRAIYYRNLNQISHDLGTAVTVQAMTFGNLDDASATGVCFTRNPSTGEKVLYGEYLTNAQGEDVVAGVRTPKRIEMMKDEMPETFKQLNEIVMRLERHYLDMQDIEFTIQQGSLFLLQTRTGKRTAASAVKVAVDMANEGLISKKLAVSRVDPSQINQLLLPSFDQASKEEAKRQGHLLAIGLNASPGAASGEAVFDPDESEKLAASGKKVVLIRVETCPDDIHGIVPAQGVITSRGGMTSHAAVVARGMGKPCVAGCESLKVNLVRKIATANGREIKSGDLVSIDGSTGEIFIGAVKTSPPTFTKEFETLLSWCDEIREMGIRTNADTPDDAKRAREFGAQGIGLCRTEHMFMEKDRLPVMQAMILASSKEERLAALQKLLPMQRADFIGIFQAMDGFPVTIRLLDPPLHEFLPKYEELIKESVTLLASGKNPAKLAETEMLLTKVHELKEANPMMGLRGCRLGLVYPEINEMQVQAIFEAAVAVKRSGVQVFPEIMIPLIGHVNELKISRHQLEAVAQQVMQREKIAIDYKFGTMIEIPRACVTADELADHAEFFSFGTNDLTQMTFGYSRDDAEGKFLQRYLDGIEASGTKEKILEQNPFEVLDRTGVGKLMALAVKLGRERRPTLKLGICGEHGGEPNSIHFAQSLGLSYVSCSPYRVPLARLAAAQAMLSSHERDR